MVRLLFVIILFIFSLSASSQEDIVIGGATWEWENTYTSPISIDGNNDNSHSHCISIYTAEELGASVVIDGLSWLKSGGPGYLDGDAELKIYLKHTTLDSVPTEEETFSTELSGSTLVFQSDQESIPIIELWLDKVFESEFYYNGEDNLMVLVEWSMPGEASGPYLGQFYGNYTNGKGAMWRGNSFSTLSYFSSISSADRPIIKFSTASAVDVGLKLANVPLNWNGTEDFELTFYNAGYDTLLSFDVQWTLDGIVQENATWNGSLTLNDTAIFSMSHDEIETGFHSIEMLCVDPNGQADQDITNNAYSFYAYSCDGPLSGLYSVGIGEDFESLESISYALNTCGIDGDVYFSFKSGVYEGQLSLHSIEGTSPNDSVFFFAENANSSAVIWEYAAEDDFDNWVVNLDSTTYVQFKDITLHAAGTFDYSRLMVIHNGASNIEIRSCQLIGFEHNSFCGSGDCGEGDAIYISSVDGDTIRDIRIIDNYFKYNASAVYALGDENHSIRSLYIEDNILRDQHRYGIYLEFVNSPKLINNHIRSANTYTYSIDGIELFNSNGGFEISNNDLLVSRQGITINTCFGEADEYAKVYNNFVYIDDLTCAESGVILTNSQYVTFMHNTISSYDECDSGVGALFIRGSDYVVKNNIISSRNSEKAISMGSYYFGDAMENYDADYNMYEGNPIAYVGQIDYDLEGWQNFAGSDDSSFVESPSFIYPGELHLANLPSSFGEAQNDVLVDIDGEERDLLSPVVGADERQACTGPLSGTYFIGIDEEFPTIRSAILQLVSCGVDGPVTMRIKEGTYNEQLDFYPIPGASSENTVHFISDLEDANQVVIKHKEPQDHVVSFTNAAFVTIDKVTLDAKGSGVVFKTGSHHNVISNTIVSVDSVFINKQVSEALSNTCISFEGLSCDSNLVMNCELNYGLYGVRFEGDYYNRGTGNQLIGNTIRDQVYFGVYGKYFNQITVDQNQVSSSSNEDYVAINIERCEGIQKIRRNSISITGQGHKYGIYGYYSNLDSIVNNFIRIESSANVDLGGIYFRNCSPTIIYNSIHIYGVENDSSFCVNTWLSGIGSYYNNIFSNTCGGYSQIVKGISTSDFNQYSCSKENHIKEYANTNSFWERSLYLYNYFTQNGDNSYEEMANFISNTDLHLVSSAIGGYADTSFQINIDIDGEIRDENQPNVGADEFGIIMETAYSICAGDSIWIGSSDIASAYLWNTGDTLSMIQVAPDVSSEYSLDILFEGDTLTYTINVEVHSIELAGLEDSYSICEGDEITLYYPGDYDSWLWSNGSEVDSIAVNSEGEISIQVTKGVCIAFDTSYVNINPLPILDLGEDIVLYSNESIVLAPELMYSNYLWSNGDTTEGLSINAAEFPLGDSLIWLQVTNEYDCTDVDSITIQIVLVDDIVEMHQHHSLSISPNPALNAVRIKTENSHKIEVFNSMGRLCFARESNTNEIIIPIDDWSSGIYFIHLYYLDDSMEKTRFIKL